MFRLTIKEKRDIGKKAIGYLDEGALVPDEITNGIVEERLSMPDCEKGFLLDGSPRTLPQARSLENMLDKLSKKIDYVIHIDLPEERLLQGMTGRRKCQTYGAIYHILYNLT